MTPGDVVRGRKWFGPHGARASVEGTYRVTAVRGDRAYVDWIDGARYCDGIMGWTNLWFNVGDERLERV